MKKLFGKIKFNKSYFILGLIVLALVFIVLPRSVNAAGTLETIGYTALNVGEAILASPILLALGVISILVMGAVGALDMMIISFLVNIVKYNNFINEPSIVDAWVIVRDLCNMFFILILLVIAFATILRLPNYEWKKLLPKLLIMAVLINFSRTICGLIIDASQVIMMTFVNAFGSGGSFVEMTKMKDYFTGVTFDSFTEKQWSVLNVVIGLLIGIMFLIISGIVLVVAMSVFLMRIVMLWILIVLSPFAFLAAAFPAGQKYASQWWSEFVRYILNGPVLAFFIWMALITSRQTINFFSDVPKQCFGDSKIMCAETFMPFILSIGMLLGGLMITQQIGGVGSSIAGKGLDWAKKIGGAPLAGAGMAIGGMSKFGLFKAGRMADTLQMKGQGLLAKGVSKVTKGYFGEKYQAKSLNYRMIKEGWNRNQATKMRDYEGTKAGAWQDQFNRTLSASIGVPIVSQYLRKKNEEKIKGNELKIAEKQGLINEDKQSFENTTDEKEQINIQARIKVNEDEVAKFKRENREMAIKAYTLGKLPIQKYARLEEQQKANEEYANIKKEDLNEEGLVHNFQTEGRVDKKRAYLMHLADINGLNSLFDARGEDMNFKNIEKLFGEFGGAAGDVAAEVSRRAEAAGNYKLMGFHRFDVTQGRSRLANENEQFEYAARKDKERYAQNHARTTHFDSLVDRHVGKDPTLSNFGLEQLLHIASNEGRMKEIKIGNYQIRYGETVINLKADIENKIQQFRDNRETGKAENLEKVFKAFEGNYGLYGKKKQQKTGEEQAKGGNKGPILYDAYNRPISGGRNNRGKADNTTSEEEESSSD